MRYFLNTSAARPIVVDGHTFTFELVSLRGGSWLGVLALDEPGASILANARTVNTDEIPEEHYDRLKKKQSASQPNSPEWPKPSSTNPALAVADRAGSLTSPAGSNSPSTPIGVGPNTHNSLSGLTAVSLLTTRNQPPPEPLLESGAKKRTFAI